MSGKVKFVQTKWGKYYPAHLRKIRRAHAEAVEQNRDTFKVDGNEFLTSFAGYLIQFLESEGLGT